VSANGNLASALLAAQQDMPHVQKAGLNPHFKSKFVTLDSLLEQVLPVLNKHGLVLTQHPTTAGVGLDQPALRTRIWHAGSNETFEDTMLLAADKQTPQGQGSAISYARRYALMAFFGLVADEDDDGAAASKPKTAKVEKSPPKSAAENKPWPTQPENPMRPYPSDDKDAPSQATLQEIDALVSEYTGMLGVDRVKVIGKMEAGPLTKQWRTSDLAAGAVLTKLRRLVKEQVTAA
jgi:hypothetical protein